jgi:hypothetical protein
MSIPAPVENAPPTNDRLLLESRPQHIIAAIYDPLPFPHIGSMQEVAFDLGVTALKESLLLTGCVFRGYRGHQLLFEQRWTMEAIRGQCGESDLTIPGGAGLALRSLHFMLHAWERLSHLDIVAIARDGTGESVQARLEVPVEYVEQRTDLHFPLQGDWWVIQAADWSDLHKREVFSQPFAMDFVKLGPDAQFFGNGGQALEDHFSWDQPVYAAAGGKVAFALYDMPDIAPGATPDPHMFRDDPRRLLGNAIAISHGNGEFSYYGHLQQLSLRVNEGEIVRRGDLIARVGNSGYSPGPHLHFHLMEGPNLLIDRGLPARLCHFWSAGQFYDTPTFLTTRLIVRGEVRER